MRLLIGFFILLTALLSLGAVVDRKTAVQRTQTDPVSYEEKKKEETEGKKGPPAPAFKLFPKEKFLVEGPVEKGKAEGQEEEKAADEKFEDWDFWFEEEPGFKEGEDADDTSDTLEEKGRV